MVRFRLRLSMAAIASLLLIGSVIACLPVRPVSEARGSPQRIDVLALNPGSSASSTTLRSANEATMEPGAVTPVAMDLPQGDQTSIDGASGPPSDYPAPGDQDSPDLSPPSPTPTPTPTLASGNTFFVSKLGNNADGRSWATAWNELNQINWTIIQTGDTILLDGGSDRMVYNTSLVVGRSGAPDSPITIKLSDESGRDGKAVIFGGRSVLLPWYGQPGYSYEKNARTVGIDLRNRAWITVDGTKWAGIDLHGFNDSAVVLSSRSDDITLRSLEVYDNGIITMKDGLAYAYRPGINLAGINVTIERAVIHDNGEDSIQTGAGGISNFRLSESWLYNSRRDPLGKIWNMGRHPDGIQVFAGGEQFGVDIERSVIGPGFMQGVLLGQAPVGKDGAYATLHDVTIKDSLFYGSINGNILTQSPPTAMTGWRIENVTSDRPEGSNWHNVGFTQPPNSPPGITIVNSIFTGGSNLTAPKAGEYVENVYWRVKPNPAVVGINDDPQYADPEAYGSSVLTADFTLSPNSPYVGKGSLITSAAQLIGPTFPSLIAQH